MIGDNLLIRQIDDMVIQMNERFNHESSRMIYEAAIDELERDLTMIINSLELSNEEEGFMQKAEKLREEILEVEHKLSICDR